jgi:hypothetical protein
MSMADKTAARYRVYLLTAWREGGDGDSGPSGLRFSLKDPRTGERRGFASAEALVAALASKVTEDAAPDHSATVSCVPHVSADAHGGEERDDDSSCTPDSRS